MQKKAVSAVEERGDTDRATWKRNFNLMFGNRNYICCFLPVFEILA